MSNTDRPTVTDFSPSKGYLRSRVKELEAENRELRAQLDDMTVNRDDSMEQYLAEVKVRQRQGRRITELEAERELWKSACWRWWRRARANRRERSQLWHASFDMTLLDAKAKDRITELEAEVYRIAGIEDTEYDRIRELEAEVAKAQSRDIVLHRWLRAKQLRINELEAQLVTIGRKMLKDETNRAIIRAAGEQPNQETIDALTEDSSQMTTYETVDEMMNDLELTTPTEVKRYVPIMQWDRETWKAVPAMRELTKHQTVFPCYRKDTDYDAEHTARVEAERKRDVAVASEKELGERAVYFENQRDEARNGLFTLGELYVKSRELLERAAEWFRLNDKAPKLWAEIRTHLSGEGK